jgi:hypothetical protein
MRGRLSENRNKAPVWGALLLTALVLGGCSTSIADMPLIGTPSDAPARSKETNPYLPVQDLPPSRDEAVIAPDQQAKIKAELAAARDRQASAAAAKDQPTSAGK